MEKKKTKRRGWLIALIVFVLIVAILLVAWFLFLKNIFRGDPERAFREERQTNVIVRCVSDANAKVEKLSGYDTKLVVGDVDINKNFSGKESSDQQISLAGYTNSLVDLQKDLFFIIKNSEGKKISGVAGRIELCDSNDMTISQEVDDFASKNAIEKTYSVHDGIVPKEAGDYRADAYLYDPATKKWYLTDRIDKVTFVK